MSDIELKVGIETGKAESNVLALVKNLNQVEDILKKLNKAKLSMDGLDKSIKTQDKLAQDKVKKEKALARKHEDIRLQAMNNIIKKAHKVAAAEEKANAERVKKAKAHEKKLEDIRLKALNNKIAGIQKAARAEEAAQKKIEALKSRSTGTSMGTNARSATKAINGHTKALEKNSRAAYRAASANKSNNAILSDQIGFWRFAGRAAALYFSNLATQTLIDVNMQMFALEQSLVSVTGSTTAAAEAMEFLRETGDQLGFTVLDLATGYKNLSAAAKGTALEGKATDAIFKTIVESSRTLGLSVADTEGSLRA